MGIEGELTRCCGVCVVAAVSIKLRDGEISVGLSISGHQEGRMEMEKEEKNDEAEKEEDDEEKEDEVSDYINWIA